MNTPSPTFIDTLTKNVFRFFQSKGSHKKNAALNILLRADNISGARQLLVELPAETAKEVVNIKAQHSVFQKPSPQEATGFVLALDNTQSVEALNLLCEFGVDLNALDTNKENVLWRSLRQSKFEIFRHLLEKGMDPNIKNENQSILEHLILRGCNFSSHSLKDLPLNIETFFKCGGIAPEFFRTGLTPIGTLLSTPHLIQEAAQNAIYQAIVILVNQGAPTDYVMEEKTSLVPQPNCLSYAFLGINEKVFVYFLDQIKDLEELKKTCQHLSQEKQAGVSISSYDNKKEKFTKIIQDKIQVLEELINEKSYQLNSLVDANDLPAIQNYLFDLSKTSPDIIKQTLNKKQQNSWRSKENGGAIILRAVKSVETFHLLCKYGLDLNILNISGENALWTAVRQGQPEVFKEMLKCGVNPNTVPAKDSNEEQLSLFVFMIKESIKRPELLRHLKQNMESYIEYGGLVPDLYTPRVSSPSTMKKQPLENLIYACKNSATENAYILDCVRYIIEKVMPTFNTKDLPQALSKLNSEMHLFSLFILGESLDMFSYFLNKTTSSDITKLESLHQKATGFASTKTQSEMIDCIENKIQEIQIGKERDLIETMLETTHNIEAASRSLGKRQKI